MPRTIPYILLLLSLYLGNLKADEAAAMDTKKLSDHAMKYLIKGDISGGIDILRPHWGIEKTYIDKFIEETKKQWPNLNKKYGKEVEVEFIRTEVIGDSYVRHLYLYKFEKHAIKWTLTFYKAKEKWEVNNLNFDENIEPLYEKAK